MPEAFETEFWDDDHDDGDDGLVELVDIPEHVHGYFRPIRSIFHWNMSPNQPPMPVLASRHFPPPKWPLRRRKDWEILPPPGIFPALKPWQTSFRNWPPIPPNPAFAFSHDDVQHGPRNPNLRERGAQIAEEATELRRRRGRPRREERLEGDTREARTSDWPSGGGAE
jgi:hypothetical protein